MRTILAIGSLALVLGCFGNAADQPQWGAAWSRNMVSTEKNLPDSFDPATGRNVKWSVPLGGETHSTPTVSGGRVYIGTNNAAPRDPRHEGDRGVFYCLSEADGSLQWQLVCPKLEDDQYYDWPRTGMASPATVEGDRVYIVTNRAEVICLDAKGLANGNDGYQDEGKHMALRGEPPMEPGKLDADILWVYDMVREAGIWPHDGAHSSILIRGNHLYLNTGTGVDNTHRKVRTPDAPSLIVLEKATGKLLARDQEKIAPNIFHATWCAPSLGRLNGSEVIYFCGGNGIIYAFEPLAADVTAAGQAKPLALKKLWQFDIDPEAPKTEVHRFTTNKQEGPSNIYGMPVFLNDQLYVAGGGDIFWGKKECWMHRIAPKGTGDMTGKLETWSTKLNGHVMSTAAVDKGLVYIADVGKTLHCLDAATGDSLWTHEMHGQYWSSPMVADGKVYLGTRSGDFWVFQAGPEKKILSTIDLKSGISATATAANETIYVATMKTLYALRKDAAAAAAKD